MKTDTVQDPKRNEPDNWIGQLSRVLEGIKRHLFCEEGVALFVKETGRLLAERNRQGRPALERMQQRLTEMDREIANIMTAIKQGLLTVSTKVELEKAEAE